MHPLFGYLDPGAGSILLQMILAGALGLTFTIKTYWRRIKGLFTRHEKSDSALPESSPGDEHR
jgi:hypothetical protein